MNFGSIQMLMVLISVTYSQILLTLQHEGRIVKWKIGDKTFYFILNTVIKEFFFTMCNKIRKYLTVFFFIENFITYEKNKKEMKERAMGFFSYLLQLVHSFISPFDFEMQFSTQLHLLFNCVFNSIHANRKALNPNCI